MHWSLWGCVTALSQGPPSGVLCPQEARAVIDTVVQEQQESRLTTPQPRAPEAGGQLLPPAQLPEIPLDEMNIPAEAAPALPDPTLPPWVSGVESLMASAEGILSQVGLSSKGGDSVSSSETGSLGEVAADSAMKVFEMIERVRTVSDVMNQATRLLVGGHKCYRALRHLHTIVNRPYAAYTMRKLQLPLLLSVVAKKQATPDVVRGLALSLSSLLTDLPAASETVDPATGSYYHIDM